MKSKDERIAEAMEIAKDLRPSQVPRESALVTLAWRVTFMEKWIKDHGMESPWISDRAEAWR